MAHLDCYIYRMKWSIHSFSNIDIKKKKIQVIPKISLTLCKLVQNYLAISGCVSVSRSARRGHWSFWLVLLDKASLFAPTSLCSGSLFPGRQGSAMSC